MEIMERYLKENYLRAMPCKFLNFWHILCFSFLLDVTIELGYENYKHLFPI